MTRGCNPGLNRTQRVPGPSGTNDGAINRDTTESRTKAPPSLVGEGLGWGPSRQPC
jgi:hypothetical protein